MADALEHGALAAASEMEAAKFTIEKKRARDATLDDLLQASGYLFCAPENLASTSGEMLEFFHSTYYQAFSTDDQHAGDPTGALALLCAVRDLE